MRRRVVVDWLGETGARAWQQWPRRPGPPADDDTVAWQAWELIHELPELSKPRACLVRHMEQPWLPLHGPEERICGLRAAGR
jgi:hypothetical protein